MSHHILASVLLLLALVGSTYADCAGQNMTACATASVGGSGCTGADLCGWNGSDCECLWNCGSGSVNYAPECTSGVCCDSATCKYRSGSTTCGTGGECKVAATCTGSSATCPSDGNAPEDTSCALANSGPCANPSVCKSGVCTRQYKTGICRPATECMQAATCTGTAANCPDSADMPNGTPCTLANSGPCASPSTCGGGTCRLRYQAAGTPCGAAAPDSECSVRGTCSGSSSTCPGPQSRGNRVCRASTDTVCDPEEKCGGQLTCPNDVRLTGVMCRAAAAGGCDVAEMCVNGACPANAFQPATHVCRKSEGQCDPEERCPGNSAQCPTDTRRPTSFQCRPSMGECDIAESCEGPGKDPDCPRDAKRNNQCRASRGICDKAERCNGSDNDCPADTWEPTTKECLAKSDDCDVADFCNGVDDDCPTDNVAPAGLICRPDSGKGCDVAEMCDGNLKACPVNAFLPIGSSCRPAMGPCDVEELCAGDTDFCPHDEVRPMTFECRAAQGGCDLPDNCNGLDKECPPDEFSTEVCRSVPLGDECDVEERCTQGNPDCPPDSKKPAGTSCDDGREDTNDDECNDMAQCIGSCATAAACDDGMDCTEDTCTGGKCAFTPIAQCVAMPTPPPIVNCLSDNEYRYDLLQPATEPVPESLSVCGFVVQFSATANAELARSVPADGGRATSFGVRLLENGEPNAVAAVLPSTAVSFRFGEMGDNGTTLFQFARLLSLELSRVATGTLVGVLAGEADNQATLQAAVAKYEMTNGTSTVVNGVWLLDRPGKSLSPPAIARTNTSSLWTVVHLRGSTGFSVDALTVVPPLNWVPPTLRQLTVPQPSPADELPLGIIIGGALGGVALLACIGAALFYMLVVRRRGANPADASSSGAAAPLSNVGGDTNSTGPAASVSGNAGNSGTFATGNYSAFNTVQRSQFNTVQRNNMRNGPPGDTPMKHIVPHHQGGGPSATESALKNRFAELSQSTGPQMDGTVISNVSGTMAPSETTGPIQYGTVPDKPMPPTPAGTVTYGALKDVPMPRGPPTTALQYSNLPGTARSNANYDAVPALSASNNSNAPVSYSTLGSSQTFNSGTFR